MSKDYNLYVAVDGSYGDANGMAIICTDGWTSDDWEELDNASDSDRRDTALRISDRVEPVTKNNKQVCAYCGSDDVWYDAWANVNDITDIRTFDHTYCGDCDGETSTIDEDDYQSTKEDE